MSFPEPFSNIAKQVTFESQSQMHTAMILLTVCHPHNFAVHTKEQRILVSESGMDCLLQAWNRSNEVEPAP